MQIYTRTGDKGYTRIIGGAQVAKDSKRVQAYGTIDELNSLVGIIASMSDDNQRIKDELRQIQQYLFDCGSDTANPASDADYRTKADATEWLEECIDYYADKAPTVDSFILPGGTTLASFLHYARTVARRAEREIITFQWTNDANPEVVKFVNRLSDYFYAIARYANAQENELDILYERSGKVFHHDISKEDLDKFQNN